MRRMIRTETLLAAAMILAVGMALASAEEVHTIKVNQKDGKEVKIKVDDTTEVIGLDDLADGEERVVAAGEHQVKVKRKGDALLVTLDGEKVGHHMCVGCGEMAHAFAFATGESGADCELEAKQVILTELGDEGEKVLWVGEGGDEAGRKIVIKKVGTDRDLIFVGDDEIDAKIGEVLVDTVGVGGPDRVSFRCPEDGTELGMAKDKATQERYLCPVCGQEMKKVEGKQIRIMTVIHDDEDDESDE